MFSGSKVSANLINKLIMSWINVVVLIVNGNVFSQSDH